MSDRILTPEQREAKNERARPRRLEAKVWHDNPMLATPEQLEVKSWPSLGVSKTTYLEGTWVETPAEKIRRLTPWIIARFGPLPPACVFGSFGHFTTRME